jgi:hypothetical protein
MSGAEKPSSIASTHPGSAMQSESVKAMNSPAAAEMPVLRAPETPRFRMFVAMRTVSGCLAR